MSNLVFSKYLSPSQKTESGPRHELSAMVDEIIKVTGVERDYPYSYWCRKVKQSKKSFGQILDICKEADQLDNKYSKGGFICNRLCNKQKKNEKK